MQRVEIHIRGQISADWSDWFDGFSIEPAGANTTVLRGDLADQTVLYAVLNRLNRLGIELISVACHELPAHGERLP